MKRSYVFFGLDASADPDPEATTPSADHGTANLDCTRSNGNATSKGENERRSTQAALKTSTQAERA